MKPKCEICGKDCEETFRHTHHYCCPYHRQKIYINEAKRKDIHAGNFDKLTVKEIKQLGFKVTVTEDHA